MKSSLSRNAIAGVAQTVISAVTLFILYRVLIVNLGTDQLGIWSVVLASTSFARLSELGLTGSVVKFVAKYRARKNKDGAGNVVQTATVSLAVFMAVVLVLIYPLLKVALNYSIDEAWIDVAQGILPWAVLSLWLSTVAGVFQAGLDGCNRIDIRSMVVVSGNVTFLLGAIWFVPTYGLEGLAIGQVVQSFLVLVMSWVFLRRALPQLPMLPTSWSKKIFREIFSYALNFQINSIAIMLFDPVTKILMSKFGGLTGVAYYEMASQVVTKLRALIISANTAVVPEFARLNETDPQAMDRLYLSSYRMVFLFTVLLSPFIYMLLPELSKFWIGQKEPLFIYFGTLLVIGWGLNTVTAPAYFMNLGTGKLNWNTASHLSMAAANVGFGYLLGQQFGAKGVAYGVLIALTISAVILQYGHYQQFKFALNALIPREHYLLIVVTVLYFIVSRLVEINMGSSWDSSFVQVLNISAYIFAIAIAAWFHPYRVLIARKYL